MASGFSRTKSDMRVWGALFVLTIARAATLSGHDLQWSWWSPFAYLWHDAGVVLLFSAVDYRCRRRPRVAWTVYALVVAYVVINVPVTRVLSTPMTWTMWRAAGGPLRDSVLLYATAANALWVLAAVACASLAPWMIHHKGREGHKGVVNGFVALVALVMLGPPAAARVDTRGLERNAWSALVVSAIPRVSAAASSAEWRRPRSADAARADDLGRLRGAAAGRNVILVSLESTAAQYLGLYGAAPDVAPNLSALAASGVVFDNAYAVYPESIKGLFSSLCSV